MIRNAPPAGQGPDGAREPQDPVLRVLDLAKIYRSGFWRRPRTALRGVSFVLERGEIFALLGHNGAGKTTTLKAILGLVHADTGRAEIFGRDHRDRRARARIGYLPESPYFYEHLNGNELLDFYGRLCGLDGRERTRRTAEVLALVGMQRHAKERLHKYSKGMLQRIGLAQALLNQPELLILDEPMSGLDPLGRREVRSLLGELKRRGTTILLSSHIVPDVEVLADSVGILREGKLQACHDLAALRAAPCFEVSLGRRPQSSAAEALLRGCTVRQPTPGRSEVVVSVPDVESLQRLLAVCGDAGVEVTAVLSRQSDLEELFLAALGVGDDAAAAAPAPSRAEAAGPEEPAKVPSGGGIMPGGDS
jgi:ABC-2 type transport system ATP-binding protein